MNPILPGREAAGNNGGIDHAEHTEHADRRLVPRWLVVAGLGYAALGATFASHSVPALVAVLVPGVPALVAAALVRRPRLPGERVGTRHWPWLVWAAVFAGWEVAALLLGELSFSLLLDPVLAIYPLRVGAWVLWLTGLWLLVRR